MALNATLDAALQGPAPLVCCLLKIELPAATLRIVDGAGHVTFGGETYSGDDPVYGVLGSIETVDEAIGTEAPRTRFVFLPSSLTALAEITAPTVQGSPVRLWFAAIDPATGLILGEPELLFLGEIDTAEVDYSSEGTAITFDVASAWERLFEANEGARLNNAFHQSVWPGEKGFEFVTQIQRQEPWGYDAPRPAVVSDVVRSGGGSGGGFVGGGFGGLDGLSGF
jgi:hypothetical protein